MRLSPAAAFVAFYAVDGTHADRGVGAAQRLVVPNAVPAATTLLPGLGHGDLDASREPSGAGR